MALCWSENMQELGKSKFPYKEALPMSIKLWQKFTPAQIIVQIIYSEPNVTQTLLQYKAFLQSQGATRVFLIPQGTVEEIASIQITSQLQAFSALSVLSFERSQLQVFSASSVLSFERFHIWMSAPLAISSTVPRYTSY